MSDHTHPRGLMLIAAFKLLKGLALLAVGFGALHLINKDLDVVMEQWVNFFRIDPNNHYIHALLERFTDLDGRKLRQFERRYIFLFRIAAH